MVQQDSTQAAFDNPHNFSYTRKRESKKCITCNALSQAKPKFPSLTTKAQN